MNLIKLFKLAQLLIEYLLHSQEYLQGYISQVDSQIKNAVQVCISTTLGVLSVFVGW